LTKEHLVPLQNQLKDSNF